MQLQHLKYPSSKELLFYNFVDVIIDRNLLIQLVEFTQRPYTVIIKMFFWQRKYYICLFIYTHDFYYLDFTNILRF